MTTFRPQRNCESYLQRRPRQARKSRPHLFAVHGRPFLSTACTNLWRESGGATTVQSDREAKLGPMQKKRPHRMYPRYGPYRNLIHWGVKSWIRHGWDSSRPS